MGMGPQTPFITSTIISIIHLHTIFDILHLRKKHGSSIYILTWQTRK